MYFTFSSTPVETFSKDVVFILSIPYDLPILILHRRNASFDIIRDEAMILPPEIWLHIWE